MKRSLTILIACVTLLLGSGCGSSKNTTSTSSNPHAIGIASQCAFVHTDGCSKFSWFPNPRANPASWFGTEVNNRPPSRSNSRAPEK